MKEEEILDKNLDLYANAKSGNSRLERFVYK